jgi:hypothetical protein
MKEIVLLFNKNFCDDWLAGQFWGLHEWRVKCNISTFKRWLNNSYKEDHWQPCYYCMTSTG